jgi:hypothetical protein
MRTAINAIANVVAAAKLNVVAVRDADRTGSGSRSRLFGPFGGKKSAMKHAYKHAPSTTVPATPGEIAEYPRMLAACQQGRLGLGVCRTGSHWRRREQLSTLLLAEFALGIAG